MKTHRIFLLIFSCLIISAFKTIHYTSSVTDYLSVPGPLSFEGEVYNLAWSHFNKDYYKQEYIRDNDSLNRFNKMITIDVLVTNSTVKDLVGKKIREIERRKGKDPVANYQVIENKQNGEFLLDFLISEGDLYEWNAYRYKSIKTSKGKAIMLFAYSLRSFEGAELNLDDFFPYLKKNRETMIEKVADYSLPTISLKQ